MKTLQDLQLKGKRVILRVDINVPMQNGKITDDTRIQEVLPSIKSILSKNPKQLTILAHQGRKNSGLTLDIHAKVLESELQEPLTKANGWRDEHTEANSRILLLENVRLSDESNEEKSRKERFAMLLSTYGDIYINDAFSVCHRDHASVSHLPLLVNEKAMGPLLEKEMNTLGPLINSPNRLLTIILGGAKLETKLPLMQNFIGKAKYFLLGGGIANTFLYAQGREVGGSLCEKEQARLASGLMAQEPNIVTPEDVVVAGRAESASVEIDVSNLQADLSIFDIGPGSVRHFIDIIHRSETIVWNGPLGYFEKEPYDKGSIAIAKALAESKAKVVIGGGDTIAVLKKAGISLSEFYHVSTGGGAMLELLGGKELPGITALR
jgi:phosphoglycerate kinase